MVQLATCLVLLQVSLSCGVGEPVLIGQVSDLIWRDEARCGINSTYVFLRLVSDETVDYKSIESDLLPFEDGTSVGEIRDCIKNHSINAVVLQLTPRSIHKVSLPSIFFMEPIANGDTPLGHFNVVVDVQEHYITYIDGTTCSVITEPLETFVNQWSGIAICHYKPTTFSIVLAGFLGALSAVIVFYVGKTFLFRIAAVSCRIAGFLAIVFVGNDAFGQTTSSRVESRLRNRDEIICKQGSLSYSYLLFDSNGEPSGNGTFEFDWCGISRKIAEWSTNSNTTSIRTFDGEKFTSRRDRNSCELLDTESVLNLNSPRLLVPYFQLAGIELHDPTLRSDSNRRLFDESWRAKVKCSSLIPCTTFGIFRPYLFFDISPKQIDQYVVVVCHSEICASPTTILLFDETGCLLEEIRMEDFRPFSSTVVPWKLTHQIYQPKDFAMTRILKVSSFTEKSKTNKFSIDFSSNDRVATYVGSSNGTWREVVATSPELMAELQVAVDKFGIGTRTGCSPTEIAIGSFLLCSFLLQIRTFGCWLFASDNCKETY